MLQIGLQIDIDDDIINLIADRSKGHLRDAHMLLEQYKMIDRKDFIELFRSCSELYEKFVLAVILKQDAILPKIIDKMLHYKLSDLKSEYELFVLNIIKLFYNASSSDNKQMIAIINYFKHKKNNFIDIINDYRNYDMFNSDIRFVSLMWLLADRIRQILK